MPHTEQIDGEVKQVGWYFPDIFDLNCAETYIASIDKLVTTAKINKIDMCGKEADIILNLIQKVLLPLFGTITLERSKRYG